jgi:sugar phosphate isomerase/epimerase
MGRSNKLLIENINYSPFFLKPFAKNGLCDLCLDLGHLILGKENVIELIKEYLHVTKEIHLHGVNGYEEHLSLSILPKDLVQEWLRYLIKSSFKGVINLEVFNPRDLKSSMDIVFEAFREETQE